MMQPIYINHIASIHPDGKRIESESGRYYLAACEPDYKAVIANPTLRRRMSRIVKMGVACGLKCLGDIRTEQIGAVITATGWGCLADTEKFLSSLIDNDERMINPTPFIQSTFNTIGAQIALIRQIHAYNMTYAHRGLSFESALTDALMRINEGDEQVLLGSVDEMTPSSHAIQQRLGLLKGNITAGEGAHFFLLGKEPVNRYVPIISDVETFIGLQPFDEVSKRITAFLERNGLQSSHIDCLVTGKNGCNVQDAIYTALEKQLFPQAAHATFKESCGEYPTASAYALFRVAQGCIDGTCTSRTVLIYNHYQSVNHSLILIRKP